MREKPVFLPRYISMRYVSVGKRSHLVSFMSAIAVAGLALGVAILITVLSVMNGFDREMRESILSIVPHITLSTEENLSDDEWQEITMLAASSDGVQSVEGVIEVGGIVASAATSRAVLINGVDPGRPEPAISRFIRSGSFSAMEDSLWGIVLGQRLAERLGVGVGDRIDLFSTTVQLNPLTPLPTFKRFEVAGVFQVGTQELDDQLVLINREAAQRLFRLRTPYNSLQIQTTEVLQAARIADDLAPRVPASMRVSTWSSQFGSIYENIRFSRSIIAFMLWLLVGVAAFNLVVSLIMIVRDKKGDIAILRTLGASPRLINRIFLWQGGLIALLGITLGVGLGVLGAYQITNLAAFIEQQFSVQLLSAEVYPIDFLPSELRIGDIVMVILGVLALSLAATLYPARRAAAIEPAEALRGD